MINEFTMNEAVELILNFYYEPLGYWEHEIKDCPEAQKFISAGYTCIDEKYDDLYTLNKKGENLLHEYIKEISQDFIKFMCNKGLICDKDAAINWFNETYKLNDIKLSDEIYCYICRNLYHYGFKATHFRKKGKPCILVKMS